MQRIEHIKKNGKIKKAEGAAIKTLQEHRALAPEVTWPKDETGHSHRNSTYAFMATLEIQFGK